MRKTGPIRLLETMLQCRKTKLQETPGQVKTNFRNKSVRAAARFAVMLPIRFRMADGIEGLLQTKCPTIGRRITKTSGHPRNRTFRGIYGSACAGFAPSAMKRCVANLP